jgi:hypothetical protein
VTVCTDALELVGTGAVQSHPFSHNLRLHQKYIIMKLAIASSFLIAAASAFSPFSPKKAAASKVTAKSINGWTPNENEFAWGLPGSIAPIAQFDPLGYAEGASLDQMKSFREAELQHGRVAM